MIICSIVVRSILIRPIAMLTHALLLLLLTTSLTSCDNQRLQNRPQTKAPSNPIDTLIYQANQAPSARAAQLRLEAANMLQKNGELNAAEQQLSQIDTRLLLPEARISHYIISAKIALAKNDFNLAEQLLTADELQQSISLARPSAQQQNELSILRATVFELQGKLLNAAEERIFIDPMLSQEDMGNNQKAIWQDLTGLSTTMLETLSQNATQGDTRGWFELAWIYKAYQDDLDSQVQRLSQWRQRYANHPAAINLPEDLMSLTNIIKERPTRIAVMLPNEGAYFPVAQAIKKGFLAAHSVATEKQQLINGANNLNIQFYDSSSLESFQENYQLAVANGAQVIIGPLQKEHVKYLQQQSQLPVPTIALNYLNDSQENPVNFYQFGLSAEDEAYQVALRAQQLGYKNAGVIYPEGDWGQRVQDAFAQAWQSLGGNLLNSASFSKSTNISDAIKQLLLITESQTRKNEITRITGKKPEFQPRRRHDIDFVFVFASPQQARQIKPLFDFHYARKVPLLASSRVNEIKSSQILDSDLNGIEFCDIPWLFDDNNETKATLKKTWPDTDYRFERFYALGADAYSLHSRIQMLSAVKNSRFFGATGSLSLKPNNSISRGLYWAKFKHGKAVVVQTAEEFNKISNDSKTSNAIDATQSWLNHGTENQGIPGI